MLLHVPSIPGWELLSGSERQAFLERAQRLNDEPLIRLDAVFVLKNAALQRIFECSVPPPFDPVGEVTHELRLFSIHAAATRRLGSEWRRWPRNLNSPSEAIASDFASDNRREISFNIWCQQVFNTQLKEASEAGIPLIRDMPVGTPLQSADGWIWQDLQDHRYELGAPPDYFNLHGHRWGLSPFKPDAMQTVQFDPYKRVLKSHLRYCAGIRLDHAYGLIRQYWIPRSGAISDGLYMPQPSESLLELIRQEVNAANAFVITEELGSAPARAAEVFRSRGFRRLVVLLSDQFAKPSQDDVATVTTHDLPTVAGLRQMALFSKGHLQDIDQRKRQWMRLTDYAGVGPDVPPEAAITAAYSALARSEAGLVLVPIEDALGCETQVNMPGLFPPEYPSFVQRLPSLDHVKTTGLVGEVITALGGMQP